MINISKGSKKIRFYKWLLSTTMLPLLFGAFIISTPVRADGLSTEKWRPLPIRSEWEFKNSLYGGEGEQLFHGIARSRNNPDYIYLNQDVQGAWRSRDSGKTWEKTLDRGLNTPTSWSIAADPNNPNLIFSLVDGDNKYHTYDEAHKGLYRSENGGDDWVRVLLVESNIEWSFDRSYRHNIAYDPSSVDAAGAKRWYLAVQSGEYTQDVNLAGDAIWTYGGIYVSEDRGLTWAKKTSLNGHHKINQIKVHPTNGNILYIASLKGLYVSYDGGNTVQALGDLPNYSVRSVEINPFDPEEIYVSMADTQYYRKGAIYTGSYEKSMGIYQLSKGVVSVYHSIDGGEHFTALPNSEKGVSLFMNPSNPNYLHLINYGGRTWVSKNGGASWEKSTFTKSNFMSGRGGFGNLQSGISPNPANPEEVVGFGNGNIVRSDNGGLSYAVSQTGFTGFAGAWYSSSFIFDIYNPDWLGLSLLDVTMAVSDNAGSFFSRRNSGVTSWLRQDRFEAPRSDTDTSIGAVPLIPWFGSVSGALQPVKGSGIMIASIGKYFKNYLMRSTDRGKTWTLYDETVFSETIREYTKKARLYPFIGFDLNDTDTVYAGDKVSYDAGLSWETLIAPSEKPAAYHVVGLSYDPQGTWVYLIGDYNKKIYRSRTDNISWELVFTANWKIGGFDKHPIVTINPNDPSMIMIPGDPNKDGDGIKDLAILHDGIIQYTGLKAQVTGSGPGTYVNSMIFDPKNPNVLYANFSNHGNPSTFRSVDGGNSWQNIDFNMPLGAKILSVNPATGELFAGSTIGTWILPPPYPSETPNYNIQYYPGIKYSDPNPATVPSLLSGEGIDENTNSLTWNVSTHLEGGVMNYKIYRNSQYIGLSYSNHFIDNASDLENQLEEFTSYRYQVSSVSRAGVESALSVPYEVTTTTDFNPPQVIKVPVTIKADSVRVIFNEPLDEISAQDVNNYTISGGIQVISAKLSANRKIVDLNCSQLIDNAYSLLIEGVRDNSSQHNQMQAVQTSITNISAHYPNSQVSHWTLDDSAEDVLGTNNGQALDGDEQYVESWINTGLNFPNSTGGVVVANNSSLYGMDQFTFSLWAKKHNADIGGRLFEKYKSYRLTISDNTLTGYIFVNGQRVNIRFANEAINNNAWHHYALVYNALESQLTLYVDGENIGTKEANGSIDNQAGRDLYLARNPWGESFSGVIDEVKLFHVALQQEAIKALASELTTIVYMESENLTPVSLTPVSYWSLDGNTNDLIGENHGKANEGEPDPSYISDQQNQAVFLDGTNVGGIFIHHNTSLTGMKRLTFALWAKKEEADIGGNLIQKHKSYKLTTSKKAVSGYVVLDGIMQRFYFRTNAIYNTDWHHYALVVDSSAALLTVYVDGEVVGSSALSGTTIDNTPTRDLIFGRNKWGKSYFGMIDEVKMFHRALNPAELASIIN